MKNIVVRIPSIKEPIVPSPGFEKKALSHSKLDIMALCGFGCRYCSSNNGNYLRINRQRFATLTEEQTGQRLYPASSPHLSFQWPDILEKLEAQLSNKSREWGMGRTLMFSMLTDGFSPSLVADGTTRAVLELVLKRTSFRVRILTKNAVVGAPEWVEFFKSHPGRFVVGLSTGTTDDQWARRVELGTSPPTAVFT
jgi:DNA repair photolyase